MGGEITVKSEVDKGSSFRVKLLLSEVARPRIASRRTIACAATSGRGRPFWSSTTTRSSATWCASCLEPLGFEVLTAASGRECLALAEQHKPNLILLDIAMPEMDGWEVARRCARLRASAPPSSCCRPTPSIQPAAEGERLHDDYLMKPIDLRQLLGRLHALLNIEWTYEPEPRVAAGSCDRIGPIRAARRQRPR